MRTLPWVSAILAAVAAALLTPDANAAGPIDFEVAVKGGAGTTPGGGSGPNPLGFGLGGRAGVSIFGLYGGVSIINYFGESQSVQTPVNVSTSVHSLLYGFEGGYGSKFGPITLRGQVGVGNYHESFDISAGPLQGSPSHDSLYLEPGATLLVAIGTFLVGADANVLILPNQPDATGQTSFNAGFTLHAQIGVRF
jgi:hypothetical protein